MNAVAAVKDVPVDTFPLEMHLAGEKTSQPVKHPSGANLIRIEAKRDNWPGAVEVITEASYDDGLTWTFLCAFTAPGGDIIDPQTGLVAERSMMEMQLDSKPRLTRTRMVTQEALSTAVKVTAGIDKIIEGK